MNSIRIDVLPQEDIWTYYLGYYMNSMELGYPIANTEKEPALVYLTKEDIPKNSSKVRISVERLERNGIVLNLIAVSCYEGKVQKRLEHVFDRYEVHHLFNRTDSVIAGEKQWKTVSTKGKVLDIDVDYLKQKHVDSKFGWPYFFMLGELNLYPPVFHPEAAITNTSILKAFAMSLDNNIEVKGNTRYKIGLEKFSSVSGKFTYEVNTL